MEDSSGVQYTHAFPDDGLLLVVYPRYAVVVAGDGSRRRARPDEIDRMYQERREFRPT